MYSEGYKHNNNNNLQLCTVNNLPYHVYIQNQRTCTGRVTVVVLSVCLSVATKSAAYLVYTKTRCHRDFLRRFKVFVVWFSLKTLHSKVLASFADCHCFPRFLTSSRWTKGTAMVSSQREKCA